MSDTTGTVQAEMSSLRDQLATVRQGLNTSPGRRALLIFAGGILAVILATAYGQILLNRWNQPFYDSLQRRDLTAFLDQLVVFAMIAGGLLVLNIGQQWLNQRFRLKLRESLTTDLVEEWLKPNRAFRVANAGAIGVNPDQRMQQDAGHLSDLSTDLGVGLLQSIILLVSFVGVLWALSSGFVFNIGGHAIAIPGYMVWAAFLYAGIASWLSWLVGRPLIGLNSDRYAREADLRFSMVRVNENIDAITLSRGEASEKRRLATDLAALVASIMRIFRAQINLGWVTDTYGWITVVAPILVAAPVYFAGDITFGGLMMAVGAFNQVHSSLRWFVNNIGGIADWRATLMRVADFRMALKEADQLHGGEQHIQVFETKDGTMVFEDLIVGATSGCSRLAEKSVRIEPGEHVLITGDPSAGKTLFFRAVAGLWPWGAGRIGMPAGANLAFVPRTPYFAPGTLREMLIDGMTGIDDASVTGVLAEAGLDHLASSLDRHARWDRELNEEEQRLVAFARLALQKPDWVVIDEAMDTFSGTVVKRVFAMLGKHLPKAGIINIGRGQHNYNFFPRALSIIKCSDLPALKPPRVRAGALEPPPVIRAHKRNGNGARRNGSAAGHDGADEKVERVN
ncbi:ABC transporter ATP-binding protein/permease [Mesorhizobium sp. 1M-11]|uniref:ABC transporter ATP-binding protein/permease n=1 Tax=Mesorhizobium sp. 1M-11 TaxID=1529006 RepID=UPI0009E8FBE0|nr:ABC transporter ATP-binding protein/permease [Mesorhizobium sp. 1M-11]